MAISVSGIGSGLDLNGLVGQLIAAQSEPANRRLDTREAGFQARISAYGTLKSALTEFQSSLSGLRDASSFGNVNAGSSDPAIFTATATSTAATGSYSVEVTNLAQSHKLASAAFASSTDAVGEGTLSIRFGTYDSGGNTFSVDAERDVLNITIDSTNNTLVGIRDALNQAGGEVSASIVNDGTGERLVLTSTETGASSSLEVTVTGDSLGTDVDSTGLSQLAYDPTQAVGAGKNLTETTAAEDATFVLDGLTITRGTNAVTGAIEGVTLNLQSESSSGPEILSVSKDSNSAVDAIQGFVDGFNALNGTFDSLAGFNADTGSGGVLLGDSLTRGVESNIRNLLVDVVDGLETSSVRSLVDLGITTAEGGNLTLDSSKLEAALADDADAVAAVFGVHGYATDSSISFTSSGAASPVGRFAVDISAVATRGQYAGAPAASLVVDATNDTFSVSVDGEQSGAITLTQKTYASEAALAAEIQARINADDALDAASKRVSVSFSAGQYVIQSTTFGSDSSISITAEDTNSATTLGLGAAAGTATAGTDVAGTIGNAPATGAGQLLTGTALANDIAVTVAGGGLGLRGTVTFSRGLAEQVNGLLSAYLDDDAALSASIDGLNEQVEQLGVERESLTRRLEATETRLRAQFSAMDALVAQLQSTSNFLAAQLASIPTPAVNRN